MLFKKRRNIALRSNYSQYREDTRKDFRGHCAYCFRHEDDLGGQEHFDQDHFRPKKRFRSQIHAYKNLYWCCKGCNATNTKSTHWPLRAEKRQGYAFADSCVKDPEFNDYFEFEDKLVALTPVGFYTIRRIRLNRDSLLKYRERRRLRRQDLLESASLLRDAARKVKAKRSSGVDVGDIVDVAEQLASLLEVHAKSADFRPSAQWPVPVPEVLSLIVQLGVAGQ